MFKQNSIESQYLSILTSEIHARLNSNDNPLPQSIYGGKELVHLLQKIHLVLFEKYSNEQINYARDLSIKVLKYYRYAGDINNLPVLTPEGVCFFYTATHVDPASFIDEYCKIQKNT